MKRIGIVYNDQKVKAIEFYNKYLDRFKDFGLLVVSMDELHMADIIVVVGGDGTLLRASKMSQINRKPLLAVNMGSLGFLTDVREEETFSMIENILKGNFNMEKRFFIRLKHKERKYLALNDIVITRSSQLARIIVVKISANDRYVNTYRADGIIISTPTGSTAYNLSAGGPILCPDLNAMIITPIAPHTLSARPIVMNGNDKISFELVDSTAQTQVMIDGQQSIPVLPEIASTVTMSKKFINLIKPLNRDYFAILREKLKWGDDLLGK